MLRSFGWEMGPSRATNIGSNGPGFFLAILSPSPQLCLGKICFPKSIKVSLV